jgi:hypothetical protein
MRVRYERDVGVKSARIEADTLRGRIAALEADVCVAELACIIHEGRANAAAKIVTGDAKTPDATAAVAARRTVQRTAHKAPLDEIELAISNETAAHYSKADAVRAEVTTIWRDCERELIKLPADSERTQVRTALDHERDRSNAMDDHCSEKGAQYGTNENSR